MAGRVIIRQSDGNFSSKLVRIDSPILHIPTLAIHLNRSVNEEGFKFNNENELVPILATSIQRALDGSKDTSSKDDERHHGILLDHLASELKVKHADLCDFELCLYDTQPAAIGGIKKEFIFSPRLDNLMMSYTAMASLIASLPTLNNDHCVRMISIFDNEEVGSNSLMGAASTLPEVVYRRLGGDLYDSTVRNSLLVSADMAHGLHPNYASKHEANHQPAINGGLVIKHNCNQRYATNAPTAFLIREIAKRHGLPIQDFVVRQDTACGSTIGPIVSTGLGVRTIDVGIPQFSMHSIREMVIPQFLSLCIILYVCLMVLCMYSVV